LTARTLHQDPYRTTLTLEGAVPVAYSLADSDPTSTPITGVRDPRRLQVVVEADLPGHLGDPDLDAVVETLRLASGSPIAVVNIVTADLQTYPAEVGVGAACTSVPDGLSFCAEVVDTGKALLVSDAAMHPVYSQNPLVLQGIVGAYAGVPLVDQGVVLGSVSIFDSRAREFPADVLAILQYQAGLAAAVLALRRSARTDGLTGLPNRALFCDRLGRALTRLHRHLGMICVMYLDIDHFKFINDTHGHHGGDQVLVELGIRLASVLRPSDTVARFGGDEFVILCEDLNSATDAEEMAARMVAAATEPWAIQGKAVSVDVSIGFAVTDSSTTEAVALLRDADDAMYLAKAIRGSASVIRSGADRSRSSSSSPDRGRTAQKQVVVRIHSRSFDARRPVGAQPRLSLQHEGAGSNRGREPGAPRQIAAVLVERAAATKAGGVIGLEWTPPAALSF